jgi:hypothetical protein
MKKIAVLDDYQNVALKFIDWRPIQGCSDTTLFHEHLADPDALVARLAPIDGLCVIRERTTLPRQVLALLPRRRFITSTGARNSSTDLYARELGIGVACTGASGFEGPELTQALVATTE